MSGIEPETVTPERSVSYPDRGLERHYDRGVWPLGEEGDEVMVEGHGRRSMAALSAYTRGEGYGRPADISLRWVSGFDHECGCTEEEHARHGDEDEDEAECFDSCEHIGLPPCGDEYSWVVVWARADGPPALPVLMGTWR